MDANRDRLLRRAGYDDAMISEVARVMEYSAAWELYDGGGDWTAHG